VITVLAGEHPSSSFAALWTLRLVVAEVMDIRDLSIQGSFGRLITVLFQPPISLMTAAQNIR